MKKLHIHSDNSEWFGSENMPGVFMNELKDEYEISFSYRFSKEYERGLKKWVKDLPVLYPLNFLTSYFYNIPTPFKIFRYPAMTQEMVALKKVLDKVRPDILHINNGGYPGATSCNSAAIVGGLLGIPKITYMINSTTRNLIWERPITQAVVNSVDTFITASEKLRNKSKFLSKDRNKEMIPQNFSIIPNTVLPQKTIPPFLVKYCLNIEDDFFFLFIGRGEKRKGINILNSVSSSLNAKVIFKIEGKLRGYKWFDIDDHSLINACDCLVVPSLRDEDFPNVILIAMMYGKPVIASRIGGIPEMVQDNKTGILVSPGDKLDLFIAMNSLLEKPVLGELMGIEAKGRYYNMYSRDLILKKYKGLWDD